MGEPEKESDVVVYHIEKRLGHPVAVFSFDLVEPLIFSLTEFLILLCTDLKKLKRGANEWNQNNG